MPRPILPAAFWLIGASAAFAAQPLSTAVLEPAFTGTIVSTYPDGRVGKLWLSRDGGYRALGRHHNYSNGRWTLKGAKICLMQSRPIPAPFAYCTAIHAGGVGVSWHDRAVTGEPITVSLIAGRAGSKG